MDKALVIVVGAGITGLTLAERLANKSNKKVLILEKRGHLGGNCYDFVNEKGILVSKYGPHVFHTNDEIVWKYLGEFTEWEKYEHRVLSSVGGILVPIPVNIETINNLFGVHLRSGKEMEKWLDNKRIKREILRNSRDTVVSKVGKELYKLMFRGYTKKQWNLWPKDLEPEVLGRIPVRFGYDDRYFTDKYQARPVGGYTKMFYRMIKNPNIELRLNTDYFKVLEELPKTELVIFTGRVDKYVEKVVGEKIELSYRSVKFRWRNYKEDYHQPVGVINYPSMREKFVRTTEYKHLTGQKHKGTTVSREYPKSKGEPFYPILTMENRTKYNKIEKITQKLKGVEFAGRLGKFEYLNMDMAIGEALELFKKIDEKK